jgi:hypothetical protein
LCSRLSGVNTLIYEYVTTLENAVTTQMKAYFLLGTPPTIVGLAYPSELLYYFIPAFYVLSRAALSSSDSLKWWAQSVVVRVFGHANARLRYGNAPGENNSYYMGKASDVNVPIADCGAFLFSNWANRTSSVCNCTDLAYAVSAGIQALGMDDATARMVGSVLSHIPRIETTTNIVFQRLPHVLITVDRFCYVGPGPLFGYMSSNEKLQCNNPFWLPNSRPKVPDMDPARTTFRNHTGLWWISVLLARIT